MDTEITYPVVKKYSLGRVVVMRVFMWLFVAAAAACIITNICTAIYLHDRAWSVIALFGMWWVWIQFIHTDIAGYNRIAQFVKGIEYICILLLLINIVFVMNWQSWLNFVFPIVIFPALAILGILLFSDFRKQKHNIMPLINFDFYCLVASIIVLCINGPYWPVIVLLCVSAALLLASVATMRLSIFKEFKKYFSAR